MHPHIDHSWRIFQRLAGMVAVFLLGSTCRLPAVAQEKNHIIAMAPAAPLTGLLEARDDKSALRGASIAQLIVQALQHCPDPKRPACAMSWRKPRVTTWAD